MLVSLGWGLAVVAGRGEHFDQDVTDAQAHAPEHSYVDKDIAH